MSTPQTFEEKYTEFITASNPEKLIDGKYMSEETDRGFGLFMRSQYMRIGIPNTNITEDEISHCEFASAYSGCHWGTYATALRCLLNKSIEAKGLFIMAADAGNKFASEILYNVWKIEVGTRLGYSVRFPDYIRYYVSILVRGDLPFYKNIVVYLVNCMRYIIGESDYLHICERIGSWLRTGGTFVDNPQGPIHPERKPDLTEAEFWYRKGIDTTWAYRNNNYINLGKLYEKMGKLRDALEVYEKGKLVNDYARVNNRIQLMNVSEPYTYIECIVCLERGVNCCTPCGHLFCFNCASKISKCPNCRVEYTKDEIRRIWI